MERRTIPDHFLIEIVYPEDPERNTLKKQTFACLDGGVSNKDIEGRGVQLEKWSSNQNFEGGFQGNSKHPLGD